MPSKPATERQPWSIERRIPVTLLLGLILHALATVWFFAQLTQTVQLQAAIQRELREEVRALGVKVDAFTVPAALQNARLTAIEQQLGELRGRVSDNERQLSRTGAVR